jgi:hypothetical protein
MPHCVVLHVDDLPTTSMYSDHGAYRGCKRRAVSSPSATCRTRVGDGDHRVLVSRDEEDGCFGQEVEGLGAVKALARPVQRASDGVGRVSTPTRSTAGDPAQPAQPIPPTHISHHLPHQKSAATTGRRTRVVTAQAAPAGRGAATPACRARRRK